jgi:hypothetical protein
VSDLAPAASVPAPAPAIGAVEAVVGTFTKPSDTFARLVARPTWWLPLLLSVLVGTIAYGVASPKVDVERAIRDSIEKSGRSVPESAIQQRLDFMKKWSTAFLAVGAVAATAFFFVVPLVLWGGAKAMGADARYSQLLAIWGHGSLPFVISGLVSIPLFLKERDASLTQDQMQKVLASNLGAFLDESTPGALRALASSVDIFSIAVLFLLVLGFRKLPGLSKGAATWTPIVLWVLAVAVKVVWKAVMG